MLWCLVTCTWYSVPFVYLYLVCGFCTSVVLPTFCFIFPAESALNSTSGSTSTSALFLYDVHMYVRTYFCSLYVASIFFHRSNIWRGRYGVLGALPWVWQSGSGSGSGVCSRFRALLGEGPSIFKLWFQALEFAVSCIYYCTSSQACCLLL